MESDILSQKVLERYDSTSNDDIDSDNDNGKEKIMDQYLYASSIGSSHNASKKGFNSSLRISSTLVSKVAYAVCAFMLFLACQKMALNSLGKV